jgi:hypothetical protein
MSRTRLQNAFFGVDWDLNICETAMAGLRRAKDGPPSGVLENLIIAIEALGSAKICLREAERIVKRSARKGGRS